MIKVEIDKTTLAVPEKLLAGMQTKIEHALYDAALFGRNYAMNSIRSGKKTGELYGRGKRIKRGKNKGKFTRYHQASAPGQPPASDTGNLANHIFAETGEGLSASIVSKAPYSIHLEYGTYKMAARPFLRTAGWQAGLHLKKVLHVYTAT